MTPTSRLDARAEAYERNQQPGVWSTDQFGPDGECYVTTFYGPLSEQRAKAYAAALADPAPANPPTADLRPGLSKALTIADVCASEADSFRAQCLLGHKITERIKAELLATLQPASNTDRQGDADRWCKALQRIVSHTQNNLNTTVGMLEKIAHEALCPPVATEEGGDPHTRRLDAKTRPTVAADMTPADPASAESAATAPKLVGIHEIGWGTGPARRTTHYDDGSCVRLPDGPALRDPAYRFQTDGDGTSFSATGGGAPSYRATPRPPLAEPVTEKDFEIARQAAIKALMKLTKK